jgi:Mg-chelatase subunit ChlD
MLPQAIQPSNPSLQIYLTASGKGGFAPTPTLSQLSVSIDQKPAQLISLRSANEDRLLFALLVDISGSQAKQAASIKEAALKLFQGLQEGGNEGHLVFFNSQIAMSRKPVLLPEVQTKLDSAQFLGGTSLYDAIADTCTNILDKSGNPTTPRRAIILITDGDDDSSKIGPIRAEEIAMREGVAIFSLVTVSNAMYIAEVRHGVRFLQEASQETGGQTFQTTNAGKSIPLLLKAIHEQWVLDLTPSQAPDQKLHSVTIKNSEKHIQLSVPTHVFLQ